MDLKYFKNIGNIYKGNDRIGALLDNIALAFV